MTPRRRQTGRQALRSILLSMVISVASTFLRAQTECLLPAAPTFGHSSVFVANNDTLLPDEPITSIQVRIETGGGIFTDDTDDVWLDLGPRAWKIGDDFKSGSTTTTLLTQADINHSYFEVEKGGQLRVRDLAYVRIEKKGICGITDAPDSLLDLAFPGGATPANLLPSARAEVEKAQAALGTAKSALTLHVSLVHSEQAAIDALNSDMTKLLSLQATAEKAAIDLDTNLQQKELDLQRGVIVHVQPITEHYMNEICDNWFARLNLMCVVGVPSTRIVWKATQAYLDAMQWLQDQRAKIAAVAKDKAQLQSDLEATARTKGVHVATLNQLLADETAEQGVQAARSLLKKAAFERED